MLCRPFHGLDGPPTLTWGSAFSSTPGFMLSPAPRAKTCHMPLDKTSNNLVNDVLSPAWIVFERKINVTSIFSVAVTGSATNLLPAGFVLTKLWVLFELPRHIFNQPSDDNEDNAASTSSRRRAFQALLASSLRPGPTPGLRRRRRLRRGARLRGWPSNRGRAAPYAHLMRA